MKNHTISDFYNELLQSGLVVNADISGKENLTIEYLTYDSKNVIQNTLFVCKGVSFKEAYLKESVENGAVCYVSETVYESVDIPYIQVSDIRKAMPYLADMFFNKAHSEVKITNITGTKGKTTTAYYVKAILDDYLKSMSKNESGVISSIDVYDGVERRKSNLTTPESIELHEHLRHAADSGMEYLTMEASSQALKYNRLDRCRFSVGIFLNISQDHISPIEHPDFEDYFSAKLRLFEYCQVACVNMNSENVDRILEAAGKSKRIVTFGTKLGSDIYGYNIHKEDDEIVFNVKCDRFDEEFRLGMPGMFNVENALAAIAAAYVYEIPIIYVKSGLLRVKASGRMEMFGTHDKNIVAIVDYAHNKLSFEKLFEVTLQEYPDYKVVVIFGCPGDKALNRREGMGTVAGMYADKIYLTADDPGTEKVRDICEEIAVHVRKQNCPYEIIEDRATAINKAMSEAEGKTIFLVAGKGSDATQKVGRGYEDYPTDGYFVKKHIDAYNKEHCGSLGIIGGVGPAASAFFYHGIIDNTDAHSDQEHIDMVILNHATMPDRTVAIVNGDSREVIDCFIEDAVKLEKLGVKNIAIPCNTSHVFFDEIQNSIKVPIINMVRESVKYAIDNIPNVKKIGIMGTDGTIMSDVYGIECRKLGVECVVPSPERQQDVMHIIYNQVKKGRRGSKKLFDGVVEELVKNGADAVILACTELSVYKEYEEVSEVCIDAMDVLVRESIIRSGYSLKK